jgi:DNA (cytosine-5)-methyltransferase 1
MQLLNTRTVLPQNRERIFFIGTLRGKSTPEIFPITESDYKYGKEAQELETKENIIAGTINLKNNSPNWSFDNGSTLIVHNLQKQSRAGGRKGHREDNTAFSIASVMMQGVEVKNGLKQIGTLDNSNSEAVRVYDPAGISKTIKFGGGQGAKTGLYLVMATGKGGKLQKRQLDDVPPLKAKDRADIRLIREGNIYPSGGEAGEVYNAEGIYPTVKQGKRGGKAGMPPIKNNLSIRRLTPLECCKLQGYNNVGEQDKDKCYTKFAEDADGNIVEVPETHQYKIIGNGVTSELVKVIFNKMKRLM